MQNKEDAVMLGKKWTTKLQNTSVIVIQVSSDDVMRPYDVLLVTLPCTSKIIWLFDPDLSNLPGICVWELLTTGSSGSRSLLYTGLKLFCVIYRRGRTAMWLFVV